MLNVNDYLRSGHSNLSLHETLQQSTSALLGVNDASTALLRDLGIESVFDLGASRIFAQADSALAATSSTIGSLPTDLLKPDTAVGSLDEIPMLPVASLRGLSNSLAEQLVTSLDVLTLRDFSFWPPRQVAKKLVAEAAGGSTQDDTSDGDRLRPQLGQYPTERVYYDSLFMLDLANRENLPPLETPLSLEDIVTNPAVFGQPALGALATYSQSWFAQGITLGHMVHSLALAPGEATRVAVVDWSRRSRAASTESINESESLSNSMDHSRAISEVQNAVAEEMQEGESMSSGWAKSKSKGSGFAGSLGGGVAGSYAGVVTGALGFGIGGSSAKQRSETEFGATSTSWSSGNRSVISQMDQTVNDRTEQHATSVRNRRATAVREVSQSEHEEVSTRVVANYNHMHALTVQYFEVVQLYRVASQLHKFQRVLFLPFQLLDFSGDSATDLVARFRGQLLGAALTARIRDILLDETGRVEIRAGVHVPIPTSALESFGIPAVVATVATDGMGTTSPGTASPDTQSPGPPRTVIRPGVITEVAPADARLVGISFNDVGVDRIRLEHAGIPTTVDVPGTDHVALATEVPLNSLESISVVRNGLSGVIGTMDLRYEIGGRPEKVTIPISLNGSLSMQKVAFFTADAADRKEELLTHLQANRAYYTQAVFENLDSASLVMLLSGVSWNGSPLADQVEPNPIAVSGNFLILRAPVEPEEPAGIVDNDLTGAELLNERGVDFKKRDFRLIPVPTGGVFAEAVLGRSNSAEKLDLTRFWNWQDSPIPMQPPEIAPVSVGTRAVGETLTPGQLSSPVLNIQTPVSLPEPAGLSAILEVLANGSLFRDMSGLQGTQAAGQAAGLGTLDAATAAGQIASTNFQAATKQATEMAKIAADMWKVLQQKKNDNKDKKSAGVSEEGARINHARDMDERGNQTPFSSRSGDNDTGRFSGGGATGLGSFGSSSQLGRWRSSREAEYADQGALGYAPDALFRTPIIGDGPFNNSLSDGLQLAGFGSVDLRKIKEHIDNYLGLLRHRVPPEVEAQLQAREMRPMYLDDESAVRELNIDLYAVWIERLPVVNGAELLPEQFFSHIRKNFNSFVNTLNTEFDPYGPQDGTSWNSENPLGAVIKLDIFGPDNASVVCSHSDPVSWVFTTIEAPDTGLHPVAGHRQFTLLPGNNGGHVFFTKGVDRFTIIPFPLANNLGADLGGSIVQSWLWEGLQERIVRFVNENGGKAEIFKPFSTQLHWKLVQIEMSSRMS